jgi:hypothetical protein
MIQLRQWLQGGVWVRSKLCNGTPSMTNRRNQDTMYVGHNLAEFEVNTLDRGQPFRLRMGSVILNVVFRLYTNQDQWGQNLEFPSA